MILLTAVSKIVQSREFPVLSGAQVNAEGVAMAQDFENGVEVIKPSTGAANEKFMGFSYGPVFTPVTKSLVESLAVPASGAAVVAIQNVPVAGQIFIRDLTTGVVQDAGDPANANEYSISGKNITFNAATAGNTMLIQYRYSPTALELQLEDNLMITTVSPTAVLNSVGVIQQGEVWTDMFDASKDFSAATAIKMAAGGILTDHTGSGSAINGMLTHVPDVNVPFLGVRFDVL